MNQHIIILYWLISLSLFVHGILPLFYSTKKNIKHRSISRPHTRLNPTNNSARKWKIGYFHKGCTKWPKNKILRISFRFRGRHSTINSILKMFHYYGVLSWTDNHRYPLIVRVWLDGEGNKSWRQYPNMSVGALNRGYKCQYAWVTCDLVYCFCRFSVSLFFWRLE